MDLYLVGMDGSGPRHITQLRGSELQPAWSPDGAWIAFRSLVNGASDIFVVAAEGTRLRRVTRLGGHSPAWSPDGTALAVAAPVKSDELTNKGALYVVRVSDGSLYEVATNDNGFGGLAWQPAG